MKPSSAIGCPAEHAEVAEDLSGEGKSGFCARLIIIAPVDPFSLEKVWCDKLNQQMLLGHQHVIKEA